MHAKHFVKMTVVLIPLMIAIWPRTANAQNGRLYVHASPPETYIFVDGKAMQESSRGSIPVPAGEHQVGLYNYGYRPINRSVTINDGETAKLDVTLDPIAETVSTPWGAMTIEGPRSAAVLLNGDTPDYFVGYIDEFNHNWWWKQELIVPVGTHQVTVTREGKTVWSGAVTVPANQRVVIDANHGTIKKTVAWSRGEKLGAQPRFRAGAASTTVVVAPVTAQVSASPSPVNCGSGSQISWSSSGAVQSQLTEVGKIDNNGSQSVQPKQTTTYTYTASGPGGTTTANTTVVVNTAIQASVAASPSEVRYRVVDGKVEEHTSSTVDWSASNSNSVTLVPIGPVDATGNQVIRPVPQKTDVGAVDENISYVLTATNVCGTTETRTATLHVVGSIERTEAKLSMNSIYFPTNLPTQTEPQSGLVESQQRELMALVDEFKKYLGTDPQAHLVLTAHADERGTRTFNQSLSERRVTLVRSFLVDHGIPADNIDTQASGKENNLAPEQVKEIEAQNPKLPADKRPQVLEEDLRTTVLANNRRVDVGITANGQVSESNRFYPHDASDSVILWSRSEPEIPDTAPEGNR